MTVTLSSTHGTKLASVFVYCSKGTHAITLKLGGSVLQTTQNLQVSNNKIWTGRVSADFPKTGHNY
jgi:hypothetical protein